MGDLVVFNYTDDVFVVTPDGTVMGRLVAQLTDRASCMLAFERSTYFVLKPDRSFEQLFRDEKHSINFLVPPDPTKLELERGQLPKPPFIVVPADRLMHVIGSQMSEKFVKEGLCPRCGDRGYWKMLALNCPYHGQFL